MDDFFKRLVISRVYWFSNERMDGSVDDEKTVGKMDGSTGRAPQPSIGPPTPDAPVHTFRSNATFIAQLLIGTHGASSQCSRLP